MILFVLEMANYCETILEKQNFIHEFQKQRPGVIL